MSRARIIVLFLTLPLLTRAQNAAGADDSLTGDDRAYARRIVPISEYVRVVPRAGGGTEESAVALDRSALSRVIVYFERDSLTQNDGIQFVRITATVTRRDGGLVDKFTERAFTFARSASPESERLKIRDYARAIHPLSFANRRKIDSVDIELEELPDWALIEVRVEPDENYAAYAHHRGNRAVWQYRVRGSRVDGAFYLGIPKVLFDTRPRNGLDYGRTSAMYRVFWLNGDTGERFPLNVGLGAYGVRTPIDVSSEGGGLALSGFLDLLEVGRRVGLKITSKVNAGVEVVPFYPLAEPPRVLIALRVGIAP